MAVAHKNRGSTTWKGSPVTGVYVGQNPYRPRGRAQQPHFTHSACPRVNIKKDLGEPGSSRAERVSELSEAISDKADLFI